MNIGSSPSTSSTSSYEKELLFEKLLIQYKALHSGGCRKSASLLEREIDNSGLVPDRHDFHGNKHSQKLREYLQTRPLSSVVSLETLIENNIGKLKETSIVHRTKSSRPIIRKQYNRELGFNVPRHVTFSPDVFEALLERHSRVLGHIDRTYTVQFDQTGNYALTAADDCTIKVWDMDNAMLRYTFRGHSNLISDLTISFCNRFMASGGADKHVRVWSLQTGATVEVFRSHSALVTGLRFIPYVYGNQRFLFSIGYDSNVIFYQFDSITGVFNPTPIIFNVRESSGQRCLSSTYSPSGKWVVVGDSQGNARLFRFEQDQIIQDEVIAAVPHHERLDSLEWCHNDVAFATSSSKWHVARIWRIVADEWKFIDLEPKMPDDESLALLASTKLKYAVTMVCWTLDDAHLVTSGSDHKLRLYDSFTGEEKMRLSGHKGEAFHLRAHPIHPNVMISSAHDGFLLVWDLTNGRIMKKFTSDGTGNSSLGASILDLAVNKEGTKIATVDDIGHITIYGVGSNDAHLAPREQFFETDYDALEYDANGFAIDSITELAPHLMRPPKLVKLDRDYLDEDWQKKVPGREKGDAEDDLICPWLSRSVVPQLPPAQLAKFEEECLTQLEMEEGVLRDGASPIDELKTIKYQSQENSTGNLTNATRNSRPAPRQRNVVPTLEDAIAEQDARRAQVDLSGYRSEDDQSYSGSDLSEESDAGEDSSDSDYTSSAAARVRRQDSDNSQQNEQQPEVVVTTSSGRRVHRPQLDSEVSSQSSSSTRKPKRARRQRSDESPSTSQEMDDDIEPSTSTAVPKTKARSMQANPDFLKSFPESMRSVHVRRFPYVAQLGDMVVYSKQGHEKYLEQVERTGLYKLQSKYRPTSSIGVEEFCVVDELRYTRKPYRLCVLGLSQTNADGERTGFRFDVRFHDMDNVPDFIILRAHYDLTVNANLRDGDQIESILDGQWWTGTVINRKPRDEDFPNAYWYCLSIRWDNGEDDIISPWDCQKKSPGRRSNTEATESEMNQYGEVPPTLEYWPGPSSSATNRENFCTRLAAALNELETLELATEFAYPVSLAVFQDYPAYVDYCIDLETISQRLENRWYRSVCAFHHDVRSIAVAALQFNAPSSDIVKKSRVLVETVIRFSNQPDASPGDIVTMLEDIGKLPDEEITEYANLKRKMVIDPEIVRLASMGTSSSSSESTWMKDTKKVFTEVLAHSCAAHFLNSDDTRDPDIAEVLLEYGGLESIKDQLSTFKHPQDVIDKVRTLIDACQDVISDNRSRIYLSTVQLMHLLDQKMGPIIERFNNGMRLLEAVNGPTERKLRKRKEKKTYNTRRQSTTTNGFYRQLANGSLDRLEQHQQDRSSLRSSRRQALARDSSLTSPSTVYSGDEADVAMDEPSTSRITRNRSTSILSDRVNSNRGRKAVIFEESDDTVDTIEDVRPTRSKSSKSRSVRETSSADSTSSDMKGESSSVRSSQEIARSTRMTTRPNPRKRKIESSSDSEAENRNIKSSTGARSSRTSRHVNYNETKDDDDDDDDDDEEEITSSVSQRGRIRRTRRFS